MTTLSLTGLMKSSRPSGHKTNIALLVFYCIENLLQTVRQKVVASQKRFAKKFYEPEKFVSLLIDYAQQAWETTSGQPSDIAIKICVSLNQIISEILSSLSKYLGHAKTAQQQFLSQLANAEEVTHTSDAFAKDYLTWEKWNKLGYTQVDPKTDTTGREKSIKSGHWSCDDPIACFPKTFTQTSNPTYRGGRYTKRWGFYPVTQKRAAETLEDIANFNVKGSPDEVVMFHGSSGVAKSSLKRKLDWKRGSGYLGKGFYLTFNPNEAKIYACRSAKSNRDVNGIVLEVTIKKSDLFNIRDEEGWYDTSDIGTFARNRRPGYGGWWDQINVREAVLKNTKIERIHIIPRVDLKHYSTSKSIDGNYLPYTSTGKLVTNAKKC